MRYCDNGRLAGLDLLPPVLGKQPKPQARLRHGSAPRGQPTSARARVVLLIPRPKLFLTHIRLTTFTFSVHVYVNRHSWLAQQMLNRSLGFNRQDEASSELEDPQAAQELANKFVNRNWTKILKLLVRGVNPLMSERSNCTRAVSATDCRRAIHEGLKTPTMCMSNAIGY
jgi:hypothetical protein